MHFRKPKIAKLIRRGRRCRRRVLLPIRRRRKKVKVMSGGCCDHLLAWYVCKMSAGDCAGLDDAWLPDSGSVFEEALWPGMDGWYRQENIVTVNSGFYRTAKFRSISIDIEEIWIKPTIQKSIGRIANAWKSRDVMRAEYIVLNIILSFNIAISIII